MFEVKVDEELGLPQLIQEPDCTDEWFGHRTPTALF